MKSGQSFVAISAGGSHSCALTATGKAYCWGDGFSGQLGFGGLEQQNEPIDVSGDQKYTRIAAGGKHTCALNGAGKAYCWGGQRGTRGQLGDASKSDRPSPVASASGQTLSDISAGGNHTCALSTSGEALCWGENRSGQLGDGSRTDRNKPVSAGGGFTSVSAGEGYSCGIAHGEAVCWGRNDKGQLGDGGSAPRATPAAVHPWNRGRTVATVGR